MKKILLLLFLFCSVLASSQVAVMGGGVPAAASSNMISNGTFDDGTDWTAAAAWSISSNVATYTTGSYSTLGQASADMVSPILVDVTYDYEFDITSSGNAYFRMRSVDGYQYVAFTLYANGHHSGQFTAPSDIHNGGFEIYCSPNDGTTFSIDNIVVTPN